MRVALLCPDASRNPFVRTYPIAKVLARRHTVELLGFRSGPETFAPYAEELAPDAQLLRRLPAFLAQARALAHRIEADAIYAFKPLPPSLWVGLLARRRLRVPLFLDIEDWELGWYLDRPIQHTLRHLLHVERPSGLLWTAITERLVPLCDEAFVVSRSLQRRFGGTILPHGADTRAFDPDLWQQAEARSRIGLPDGRYVVFTGSPMRNKGLGELLTAADEIGLPDLRVLIVGSFAHDPGYREELLARHSRRLVLVGPRPHAEMPMYLAAADVVALPQQVSRETNAQVPGKVFEAMAMACPIVATAVGDLPEILQGCGVVVPPHAPQALSEGLRRLLLDGTTAQELGRAARERCQQCYSWDAMERILDARFSAWGLS